jgi:hypothetical protein
MDVALGVLSLLFAVVAVVLFRRRDQYVFRSFGISVSRWSILDVATGLAIPAAAIGLVFLTEWSLGAIRARSRPPAAGGESRVYWRTYRGPPRDDLEEIRTGVSSSMLADPAFCRHE